MNLDRLFPDQFRAFVSGPLSVCVGRFGGIDSVDRIDLRKFRGKLYPDRFPIPWITRKASESMGRPLYGPGIRFLANTRQYVPENAELHPFGFRSDPMSMVLRQDSASFRLAGHDSGTFRIVFCRHHMPSGRWKSLQNQLSRNDTGIRWLPDDLRGPGFDPTLPFPENGVVLNRPEPVFDPESGTLVFEIDCAYSGRKTVLFLAAAADRRLEFSVLPDGWALSAGISRGEPVFAGLGFASSAEDARRTAIDAANSFDRLFAEELQTCTPALDVRIEGLPQASEFFRTMPGYQRHLLLGETDRELAIRASASKFGFFALWDDVFPSRDFLLSGEPDRTRKLLRYMLDYPWVETCPWITMHLTLAVGEYLAFTRDTAFLDEALPHLKRFLGFSEKFADPDTGLLKTSLNCGVDNTQEAGLDGLFFASCLNGWWYDSLRTLENLALDRNDGTLAERCAGLARRVDGHYTDFFFDEREGYLRAARRADGTLPSVNVFQNTHTLAMEYPYGRHLFRKILPRLAEWQAVRLWHPMGHTAVPWDSAVPCEMWKSVHMNQHLGHECRTARGGGRADEAFRVMAGYLEYFRKYRCAIETFNLAGCDGDAHQTSDWQAFSATGAAQGLLRGAGGLDWHRGGLAWVPAEESGDFLVRNFRFRNCTCSIHASGAGSFVERILVNGILLDGTLQIPADIFPASGETEIEIQRSGKRPGYPVLLCAMDAEIERVKVSGQNNLSFRVRNPVHAPVFFFSPRHPSVFLDGKPVPCEPDALPDRYWCDLECFSGNLVEIR